MSNESPSSPVLADVSQFKAPVIPVYSVSDSDEDRANALMKNLSQSLMGNGGHGRANDVQQEPDIIDVVEPVQIVDITEERIQKEPPSVQVMFMNTDIGRKYRHDIEEFFHTLMTTENLSRDRDPLPKIQSRPNLKSTETSDSESSCTITETMVIGSILVYRSYMIDKAGWPMIANMLNQTPGISIPDYIQIFAETYPPPEDAIILETKPTKSSKKCFNCGEDGHEMNKCKKPFDRRTFNRNRAQFLAKGLQYGRYHKEENSKKMKAGGELSNSLREALGLEADELPQHVYRMRELGYPPGWLLHAEATNSGLAMFDKLGKEVNLDGDCMEDGQVAEHRIRDENNLKYNSDHLIKFPGFNVPCAEGVQDKAFSRRGYPSMKAEHSLDVMSSSINLIHEDSQATGQQSQKRARYDSASVNPKKFKASHVDMDLSDGEDEIIEINPSGSQDEDEDIQEFQVIDELPPDGDSPSAPTDPSTATVTNINETLSALEEHKQKLLAELGEMEGTMTSSTPAQTTGGNLQNPRNDNNSPIMLDFDEGEATPQPSYQSMSYMICTPVIQHSGIDKLPSYDKFSDGITEHLPYENLANATGVYQKMSGVIKDVKEKMATLRPRRTTSKK